MILQKLLRLHSDVSQMYVNCLLVCTTDIFRDASVVSVWQKSNSPQSWKVFLYYKYPLSLTALEIHFSKVSTSAGSSFLRKTLFLYLHKVDSRWREVNIKIFSNKTFNHVLNFKQINISPFKNTYKIPILVNSLFMNFFKDMISAYLIPPMSSCYSVKKKPNNKQAKNKRKHHHQQKQTIKMLKYTVSVFIWGLHIHT